MKFIFIFIISLLVGPAYSLKAQSLDTLTISPNVGSVIDSSEKMQYHLFPYFSMDQFIQAVFIINADSTITLKAQLKPDSVVERPMTKQECEWIFTMIEGDHSTVISTPPNKHSSILGNDRKWSFSFFVGFSLLGPVNDIEEQMEDAGLGTSGYPTHRTAAVWNIETGYALSKKSALNFTLGEINKSTVEGFEQSGFEPYFGNRLNIKSELFSAAFNYIWRTGKGNSGFNLGPVIALHKISTDDYSYTPVTTTTTSSAITAGFNLGYTLAFVQKKSWFLAIKANYTWLPDAKIGPYTSQQSSVFEETKISMSTINIGVATGWRF